MTTVETTKPKRKRAPVPKPKDLRLNLGSGQRPLDGFLGVDIKEGPGVAYQTDLFQAPWPWPDSSVAEAYSAHLVEHIPHYRPEYGGVDGWWVFFNELYRVCQPDAKVVIIHPYSRHDRAFWDPTHTRYIHSMTWSYLNREWRTVQGLDHYDATCDFDIVTISGEVLGGFAQRNHEVQAFAQEHYFNVMPDLIVELKALKGAP